MSHRDALRTRSRTAEIEVVDLPEGLWETEPATVPESPATMAELVYGPIRPAPIAN